MGGLDLRVEFTTISNNPRVLRPSPPPASTSTRMALSSNSTVPSNPIGDSRALSTNSLNETSSRAFSFTVTDLDSNGLITE